MYTYGFLVHWACPCGLSGTKAILHRRACIILLKSHTPICRHCPGEREFVWRLHRSLDQSNSFAEQSRSQVQSSPRLCLIYQSRGGLWDPSHNRLLTELNPNLNTAEGAKKTFLKRLMPFARVGNVGPQLAGCVGSAQPAAELYSWCSSHTCSSTCGCICLWLKMCFLRNETGINNQSSQYVLLWNSLK